MRWPARRALHVRWLSLAITSVCLVVITAALLIPSTPYSEWLITLLFSTFAAPYVLVGGLVSARRPDNPVGWLMLAIGGLLSLPLLLAAYAGQALLEHPSWPLGTVAAWVTTWLYLLAFFGIVLLILVFPGGRLVGTSRRWTARTAASASAILVLAAALLPGRMDGFGRLRNPFGIDDWSNQLETVTSWSGAVVIATFLMALGTIFARLRDARGEERQQLKWFAYATVVTLVAQAPNWLPLGLEDSFLGLVGLVVSLVALPVAIAVAILQHRLYDIDVIIKRTLVYGSLTVLLTLTYLGLVLGLGMLLDPLTAQNDLAVAASTLVVAALFRPLRARVQGAVDRRFFRNRYDAAWVVASFSDRLRQQMDLETVSADLCAVVRQSVQPDHVSLCILERRT
jgi:hypothetical protein